MVAAKKVGVHRDGSHRQHDWSIGLFSCCEAKDAGLNCCVANSCCMPCSFASASSFSGGNCVANLLFCPCCFPCIIYQTRRKAVGMHSIHENYLTSWAISIFCAPCAMVQTSNEVAVKAHKTWGIYKMDAPKPAAMR
jgi:hypothetical protein